MSPIIYIYILFFNCASEKEVSSTKFHEPLNFLITIILGVLGVHYQGLGISPLKEHGAIMLFFIMAAVIYSIAFLGIKLGPQNANYLPIFKFLCVTCAILACELLLSILVDHLRLVMINLCGILVELLRRWYKQIYQYCFQTPIMILNIIVLRTGLDRLVEPRTKNKNKLEKSAIQP